MKYMKKLLVSIPLAAGLFSSNKDVSFPSFPHVKAKEQSLHLEQVQVLFRHGARSSIKSKEQFDKFFNLDPVVWDVDKLCIPPIGFNYVVKSVHNGSLLNPHSHPLNHLGGFAGGDLTNVGFKEAQDFGKWLSYEYIKKHSLISPVYSSKDVYIRSTLSKRAVLTGVGVVSGLYDNNLTETVLIHSAKQSDDDICPNWFGCKKLAKRVRFFWEDFNRVGQETLNKELGLKEGARPFNYVEIFDVIVQRKHHGLHVPNYLLDKEEEIGKLAMDVMFDILGKNLEDLKNSIGLFMDTICSNINDTIEGKCKSKMILFPSHDTTVMSFLVALGIFDDEWPPFVANVIVELYKSDDDERFVRILHNRKPVVLDESGEEFIPLDKFLKIVEKYRVKDWSLNCGNDE